MSNQIMEISDLQVCMNGRGMYYIGRTYTEDGMPPLPYCRVSEEYFKGRDKAERALEKGDFTPRYHALNDDCRKVVISYMSSLDDKTETKTQTEDKTE